MCVCEREGGREEKERGRGREGGRERENNVPSSQRQLFATTWINFLYGDLTWPFTHFQFCTIATISPPVHIATGCSFPFPSTFTSITDTSRELDFCIIFKSRII